MPARRHIRIRLPRALWLRLAARARSQGVDIATLIRRAVRRDAEPAKRPFPRRRP